MSTRSTPSSLLPSRHLRPGMEERFPISRLSELITSHIQRATNSLSMTGGRDCARSSWPDTLCPSRQILFTATHWFPIGFTASGFVVLSVRGDAECATALPSGFGGRPKGTGRTSCEESSRQDELRREQRNRVSLKRLVIAPVRSDLENLCGFASEGLTLWVQGSPGPGSVSDTT